MLSLNQIWKHLTAQYIPAKFYKKKHSKHGWEGEGGFIGETNSQFSHKPLSVKVCQSVCSPLDPIVIYLQRRRCCHLRVDQLGPNTLPKTKPRLDGEIVWSPFHALRVSTLILLVYTGNLTKMAAAWWGSIVGALLGNRGFHQDIQLTLTMIINVVVHGCRFETGWAGDTPPLYSPLGSFNNGGDPSLLISGQHNFQILWWPHNVPIKSSLAGDQLIYCPVSETFGKTKQNTWPNSQVSPLSSQIHHTSAHFVVCINLFPSKGFQEWFKNWLVFHQKKRKKKAVSG